MNHKYHTDGCILRAEPEGESDMYFTIFTSDFGLIKAKAVSVRKLESKMRYSLQPYSFASISLIEGKGSWRITNADSIHSTENLSHDSLKIFVRALRLVDRLVHGAETDSQLYLIIKESHTFLSKTSLSKEQFEDFECLLVLRILRILGYIGDHTQLQNCIDTTDVLEIQMGEIRSYRKEALSEINRALKASQL